MGEVLFFENSDAKLGYFSRKSTQGAELDMVKAFIKKIEKRYKKCKKKGVAIFLEPKLDSGYPDIIVVEFRNTDKLLYNTERAKLSTIDLKILFEIIQRYSISIEELKKSLGFDSAQIKKTVSVLSKCNMITVSQSGKYVRKRAKDSFFIVNKIISVEAKIDKWHDVAEQSFLNQWFSSESFILIKRNPNEQWIEFCKLYGIGVFVAVKNQFIKINAARKRKLPVSYGSLLFNEWIIKRIHEEKHKNNLL